MSRPAYQDRLPTFREAQARIMEWWLRGFVFWSDRFTKSTHLSRVEPERRAA